MRSIAPLLVLFLVHLCYRPVYSQKIFDVHLHGSKDPAGQLQQLGRAHVYKAALSTSWDQQQAYKDPKVKLLYGLMIPCPNGKVPYSLQPCYSNGAAWPGLAWTEAQIKAGKIDFIGEILTQYFGIFPGDSSMLPYYALAVKYRLPVGIHTGGAGPNHGAPNFNLKLGDPLFVEPLIYRFPGLKIWIMHAGDQYYKETITLMKRYATLYADISVISNPDIVPAARFAEIMQAFIKEGLEDRLMFGTDNGEIDKVTGAVEGLAFLTKEQKNKVYYLNAERFFAR